MRKPPYIPAGLALLMLICPSGAVVSKEATADRHEDRENLAVLHVLEGEDIAAIRSAEVNFQQRDWQKGMDKLVPLFREKPDMLVPSGDGRTFVSMWEYFHNRMIALPPAATEAYRSRDAIIRKKFEKAESDLDIDTIREIARDHVFTKPGRAALRFLIEHYYERRRFAEALSCVSRFENYLAFDRSDSIRVAAMKLLCLAKTGRTDEFATAAADMTRKLAEEDVQWHGVTMPFAEFAERLSLVAGAVERRENAGPLLPSHGAAPALPRRASARDAGAYPAEESLSSDIMARWQAETPFTDVYPVFSEGTIYLRLRSSMFALDLDNPEQPRWKRHFPADGARGDTISPGNGNCRMAAVFAAAAHEGRAFTSFRDVDGIARLVCLDGKSGRILWTAGKKDGEEIIDSAHVASPPACIGGSVYVTAVLPRGAKGDDYYFMRLDAADGRVIYSTFLCTRIAPRQSGQVLYPPAPAIIADGTIYVATNAGAVCAIDAMSGRLRWVAQYDQFNSVSASPGDNRFERATRRDVSFSYGAPVFHRGVLLVGPPEADSLIAMDAGNGKALWRLDNSGRDYAHLVGALNGAFLLSGRKVGAFEARTGRPLWPSEPDLGTRADSRGFLAGNLLVVPGNGIFTFIDVRNGRVIARSDVGDLLQKPLPAGIADLTGNLLPAGDGIVSASRNRIVIYPARRVENLSPETEKGNKKP